jgi:uncharacterized membrane protein YfhO
LNGKSGNLIINEIYTPFWQAWDENGKTIPVTSQDNTFLKIVIDKPVSQLTVAFKPAYIDELLLISFITSILCGILLIHSNIANCDLN